MEEWKTKERKSSFRGSGFMQRTETQWIWLCCLVPKLHHVNENPFIQTLKRLVPVHITNKHFVCLFILGNDSVTKVQSLFFFSFFFNPKRLFFVFVSDSKRLFQQADPLLPWTPSRSPKYCSRSSHPRCCPVPETDTHKHTQAHTSTYTHFLSDTLNTSIIFFCKLWNSSDIDTVTYHNVSLTLFLYQII